MERLYMAPGAVLKLTQMADKRLALSRACWALIDKGFQFVQQALIIGLLWIPIPHHGIIVQGISNNTSDRVNFLQFFLR